MSNENITFEDVTIVFRNFSGKEDTYNRAGDRNFAILLEPEQVAVLEKGNWNVKRLKPKDGEEEGQAYIQVAVSFRNKPPKVAMITSRNITYLDEDTVGSLDDVDIETADVTLNPYDWTANGSSGRKAYAKGLFVKIVEDYLASKWEGYIESQKSGESDEYPEVFTVDGEIEERN